MQTRIRQSRARRVHVAALGASLATLAAGGVSTARADTLLFDNLTAPLAGNQGLFAYSGASNDTYVGGNYVLSIPGGNASGAVAQLTGYDLLPLNNTGSNGTTAETFPEIKITYNVWGTINTGTVNASNPAFSNLLGTQTNYFTFSGGLAPGYEGELVGDGATTPGVSFSSPINLTNISNGRIGVSVNVQGSLDGSTFQSYQYLTPLLSYNTSPTTGSLVSNGYYASTNGETNGNFLSPLRATGTADIDVGTRLFGNNGSPNTYNWLASLGGSYTSSFLWTPSGPPGSNDIAVFNTSADSYNASGYTVTIPPATTVGDVLVQSDRVTFDFSTAPTANASGSSLTIGRSLSVGVPANGSTGVTRGYLTLGNSSGVGFNIIRANTVVVGSGATGLGSLTVGTNNALIVASNTSIGAGSVMTVQHGGAFLGNALLLAGTTNAWTGKLDLTTAVADLAGASLATVTNQVKAGFAGGTWTGNGITSSAAAANTTHTTAVGVIQNNQNGTALYGDGATGDPPLFAGQIGVGASDILMRYTYYGDTNLDGVVNAADYTRIDAGFIGHLTGWLNGDFNYDGVVDGTDYALMDNAFNQQSTALTNSLAGASKLATPEGGSGWGVVSREAGLDSPVGGYGTAEFGTNSSTATATAAFATAVPEPATAATVLAGAVLAAGRRRRRRLA